MKDDAKFAKELYKKIDKCSLFLLLSFGLISQLKELREYYKNEIESLNIDYRTAKSIYKNYKKNKLYSALSLGLIPTFKTKEINANKAFYQVFNDRFYTRIESPKEDVIRRTNTDVVSLCVGTEIRDYPFPKYDVDVDLSEIREKIVIPYSKDPVVSIVIPVYNQISYTLKCLRSIVKNTNDVSYEVIVADDNSTDETQNISSIVENLIVVKNQKSNGFVNNCNSGANVARGKYIYFLNNDTQVQKDYLVSLVNLIEKDPSVGITGSMCIYPDGSVQEAGCTIFKDTNSFNVGRNEKSISHYAINYVREVDYISGCALLIKNSLFKELNGFDEAYAPAYCEDSDLCLRVKYHKHLKVVYQPLSKIVHFEGKSFTSEKKQALIDKNKKTLFNRFYDDLCKNHCFDFNYNFIAKDSAFGKKQILFIDSKILSPDRDSGSRNTFLYMDFFKKHDFNVKFYPISLTFEDDNYLTDIQQLGIEVVFEELQNYLARCGQLFDYVYINRPDIAARTLSLVRKYTHAQIIFHGHDLHYLRTHKENLLNGFSQKDAESVMLDAKRKELDLYKQMDLSLFVSKDEKDIIQKELPFTQLTEIPIFMYDNDLIHKFSYKASSRQDIAFVAGFVHKPNIDAAKYIVNEIMPIVLKTIPNLKLYLIGSKPTDEVLALASDNVIVTGFVSDEKLDEYYQSIKLSVVPLRYGAGVKGKVIESIIHKVPVLTTTCGAEGIDNTSKIMTVDDKPNDFASSLIKMYQDNDELDRISELSVSFISENYTEQAAKTKLEKLIKFD